MNRWNKADAENNPTEEGMYLVSMKEWVHEYDGKKFNFKPEVVIGKFSYRRSCLTNKKSTTLRWFSKKHRKAKNITHWMPLPDLPEELK